MKLVYIEWEDAISRNQWMNKKEVNEWIKDGPWFVHSIGWIIKETDKFIILAGQHHPESNYTDELVGEVIRIPKGWIKKRKVIKL